jgi:hypothetical protein
MVRGVPPVPSAMEADLNQAGGGCAAIGAGTDPG